ncbi:MAG: hypothetical protein IJ793_04005 [Opitutales bacterium]|nr:hypothetical protein [Opitutales bacterium]
MKFNIKSLLTGTTLVVASTTGIMADPPKELKLIPNETIDHPVFGEVKVISHEEDIKYYNEHKEYDLVEDFMKYVVDVDSWKDSNVSSEDVQTILSNCVANTRAGKAMLKVITANYMREYDRIKQFYEKHKAQLETFYEFSKTEEGKVWCSEAKKVFELGEKLRETYEDKVCRFLRQTKLESNTEVPEGDLLEFYRYFAQKRNTTDTHFELWGKIVEQGTTLYNRLEKFYDTNESDLKTYCDTRENLEKEALSNKWIAIGIELKEAYEEATRIENEKKFLCIRRKIIPPCNFPTLYEHFLKGKMSIENINNVLFRALKLTDGKTGCLDPISLRIDLFDPKEVQKNYYVNEEGTFVDTNPGDEAIIDWHGDSINEKYNVLLHELMHFMNIIACYHPSNSISFHPEVEDLKLCQKDFNCDEGELEDLKRVLSEYVYETGYEMWNMYGMLYLAAYDRDGKVSESYYDPINEAVANAECKCFGCKYERDEYDEIEVIQKKEKFVRTGHATYSKEGDKGKLFASCIKELNEKKGIYKFYFDEKLRNLIPE